MTLTVDLPEEALRALGSSPADAAAEVRLAAAMKLHEIGRLSSGAAALLAGVSRVEFLSKLGEYGVPVFQVSAEDLEEDVKIARRHARRDV